MAGSAFAETSVEAYLALEEAGRPKDARHEYWDGMIRALGGASASHNRVVLALGSEL